MIPETSRFERGAQAGFTLLEVLVVMMLVSLVSVVLMQGLGLVLNLRNNLSGQMLDLDAEALKRSRVIEPLSGLVADFDDGQSIFSGKSTKLIGLTSRPLLRRPGRPLPFALTLDYDQTSRRNKLFYREDEDDPILLAEWIGDQARFKYIGDSTIADSVGWVETWPPLASAVPLGTPIIIGQLKPPQLPELIVLDTQSADEVDYAVVIRGRRTRVSRDPPIF